MGFVQLENRPRSHGTCKESFVLGCKWVGTLKTEESRYGLVLCCGTPTV